MMRIGWVLLPAVVLLISTPSPAQVENADNLIFSDDTPYHVDAIGFAALDTKLTRLDVFIQVSHDNLSFVKKDNGYFASYEITILLNDSTGGLTNEKQWTEEVRVANFDQSVSPHASNLSQKSFEIPPGRYTLTTILRDAETRVARRMTRELRVKDLHDGDLTISDIMLVRRLTVSGDRRSIVPSINPNVGNLADGFHLFLEAYNRHDARQVRFVATAVNQQREQRIIADTVQMLASGRNQVFIHADNSTIPLGDYALVLQAMPSGDNTPENSPPLASATRKFVIRWLGMPRGIADLGAAIDQLQYIATDNELKHIKEADTLEERQKRFLEFWRKRDPNPNTARNEAMEDYYAKVAYANKHFKHYIEGWRTDMGMVYIIFGPPSNVDRHPFDMDSKPYEIWSYYELNHRFVFVDQTGFGDYRLTTPIWNVWQRPRN